MEISASPRSSFSRRRLLTRRVGQVFLIAASFFIHFTVDGVTYSFGIFVPSIVQHFDSTYGTVGGIGALMLAVTWFSGPVASHLTNKFGFQSIAFTGALAAFLGFFLSHFLLNIWVLYLCIAVISGFGMGMLYLPAIVSISDHFSRWKTLATGIAMSGSGIGTFVFAPLVSFLLDLYSLPGSLLITAALLANCCVFSLLLIPKRSKSLKLNDPQLVSVNFLEAQQDLRTNLEDKNVEEELVELDLKNIKITEGCHQKEQTDSNLRFKGELYATNQQLDTQVHRHSGEKLCHRQIFDNHPSLKVKAKLLTQASFIIVALSNFLTCLGYGVPYIFLPDLAIRKGVIPREASFLISVIGICSTISKVLSGCLADVIPDHRFWLYTIVIILCGIVALFIELLISYALLMLFSVIFGTLMGTSTCLVPIVLGDMFGSDKLSDSFGLMLFFQGLGTAIGPPLAGWLYDQTADYKYTFYFFAGSMLLSGLILIFVPFLPQERLKTTKH